MKNFVEIQQFGLNWSSAVFVSLILILVYGMWKLWAQYIVFRDNPTNISKESLAFFSFSVGFFIANIPVGIRQGQLAPLLNGILLTPLWFLIAFAMIRSRSFSSAQIRMAGLLASLGVIGAVGIATVPTAKQAQVIFLSLSALAAFALMHPAIRIYKSKSRNKLLLGVPLRQCLNSSVWLAWSIYSAKSLMYIVISVVFLTIGIATTVLWAMFPNKKTEPT